MKIGSREENISPLSLCCFASQRNEIFGTGIRQRDACGGVIDVALRRIRLSRIRRRLVRQDAVLFPVLSTLFQ